jgi:hypothetical protein
LSARLVGGRAVTTGWGADRDEPYLDGPSDPARSGGDAPAGARADRGGQREQPPSSAKRELEEWRAEHKLTLDAARAGLNWPRVRGQDLDRALRAAVPRLCARNPSRALGPAAGVDQRPAVSRLGESDPQPARHDDLLLLTAAVGHVDFLRERLDAHAEWFSPLTSAEVQERADRAAKHVLAVERVAEEVERHAESASSCGRRARTDGHKLHMDDIGTGRSTRPPLTADERDALEAAGGHAAQRARGRGGGGARDCEREQLRVLLAGETKQQPTKTAARARAATTSKEN